MDLADVISRDQTCRILCVLRLFLVVDLDPVIFLANVGHLSRIRNQHHVTNSSKPCRIAQRTNWLDGCSVLNRKQCDVTLA